MVNAEDVWVNSNYGDHSIAVHIAKQLMFLNFIVGEKMKHSGHQPVGKNPDPSTAPKGGSALSGLKKPRKFQCEKCGSTNSDVTYRDNWSNDKGDYIEGFECKCVRCGYNWNEDFDPEEDSYK